MTAIWTDFGGVLTSPAPELLNVYCRRVGVAPQTLASAMWAVARRNGAEDPMAPLETGALGEHEWAAQMERELRDSFSARVDMSRFGERWLEGSDANAHWIEYLGALRRRGHFVGILSNLMPSFEPHWRRIAPAEGAFDDVVLSYVVGVRKPQREIFELAARRAGAPASECLLIDDTESHCLAAEAAGWRVVHFTTTTVAIDRLESLLAG